jgi:hypothetical protein
MVKKIVILIFVSVGLIAGPFDIKDNFFNGTSASEWRDPGTGVSYYSGPNYEYRFDATGNSMVPWVQFQLPSAKIGCNGLSIKGGFMALLGLKDIKEQLTNAGPTFAWGVLTTIEVSMPSVAAVFQKIQNWSRAIQSLLQNACQAGKDFGNSIGLGNGFGVFESNIVNDGAGEIIGWMNSFEKKVDKIANISDTDHNATKKALTTDKLFRIGSGASFLSMNFGRMMGQCSQAELNERKKVDFTARDVIVDKKIQNCNLGQKDADYDSKARSYMLSRLLFGELVVTPETLTPILEKFTPNGQFEKESAKKDLSNVTVHSQAPFGDIEYSILPPVVADPRKAAVYLIHGSDTKYSIPNTKAVFIKYKSDEATLGSYVGDANASVDGSGQIFSARDASGNVYPMVEIRAIYTTRATDGSIIDDIEWKGLVEESKGNILKYLEKTLEAKVGNTVANNYFGNIPVPNVDLNTTVTPMLVSGMSSYLNILSQAAIEKGSIAHVLPLVDLLAKYNAELFAEQLLSQIMKQIEAAESGPGLISNDSTKRAFADFRKRTQLLYNEMQKQIREMKRETVSDIQNVPKIFDELQYRLKQRRVEKMRD